MDSIVYYEDAIGYVSVLITSVYSTYCWTRNQCFFNCCRSASSTWPRKKQKQESNNVSIQTLLMFFDCNRVKMLFPDALAVVAVLLLLGNNRTERRADLD